MSDAAPTNGALPRSGAPRIRLLLVDDEAAVGRAIARSISPNFQVTATQSAEGALALFEQGERYDVVVCDLFMPLVSGMALYQSTLARFPDVAARFIFATGGTSAPGVKEFLKACGRPVLEKPFSERALEAAVLAVVEACA